MKTIKNTIFAMLALFAVSCNTDDVENRPVVKGIDAPVLESPEEGNTYVLNPETLDVLAERFVWSAANFGEGVIPNYDVEIDLAADNFDTPSVIGTTNGVTQLAASTSVFNAAIERLDATPFEPSTFQIRVKAYVGDSILYSNVVEVTVTPFSTEIPMLWMPGGYQADSGYGSNFTHATAPQLSAEAFGKTAFEGYVYIANDITSPDNGFKFSSQADWSGTNYGAGANANTLSNDGGAANIVANAGYYLVKADTAALTYSLTTTEWGIVGFATTGSEAGWNNSVPMTYNATDKVWEITIELQAGEFKFRANNGWDINLGAGTGSGALAYGGPNMTATAGTYKVKLNLSNPRAYTYTMELQ
ncbi:MAG: hypothetical protein DI539_02560 [Flavobacterium psychrophilum]|nr:MAG: hypothetical protein DI539_02560 [Flavobacterium psychrophilum]